MSRKKGNEAKTVSEELPSEGEIRQWAARWQEADPSGEGTRRSVMLTTLRTSCTRGDIKRPLNLDLRGIPLTGEDLSNLDLSGYDFSGADLTGVDLRGSNLSFARFRSACLYKVQLSGCELLRSDLSGANLNECVGRRSGFGVANIEGPR